jgi:hypothetical protein
VLSGEITVVVGLVSVAVVWLALMIGVCVVLLRAFT